MLIGSNVRYCYGQNWSRAVQDDGRNELVVDLRSADWIDCGFLVRLACVVEEFTTAGCPVRVRCTDSSGWLDDRGSEAVRYASRLGLPKLLDQLGVSHDVPTVRHHAANFRFVELQRFGVGESTDELIDMLDAQIATWGDDTLRSQLWNALYELATNIGEHANASGYVMAQLIQGKNELHFAVADSGVGIRESLRRAGHRFADDHGAITEAVDTRLTSKPKDGGFGLQAVRDVVLGQRGRVTYQSGDGCRTYAPGSATALRRGAWSGTVIDATFPWEMRARARPW